MMDEEDRIRCTLLSLVGASGTWIGFACPSHGLQYVMLIARGGVGDELGSYMWRADGSAVDLAYWALRCQECGAELAGPCGSNRVSQAAGEPAVATVPLRAKEDMAALVMRLDRAPAPAGVER